MLPSREDNHAEILSQATPGPGPPTQPGASGAPRHKIGECRDVRCQCPLHRVLRVPHAQCRQLECDERYLRTQQMHVECRSFRFRFVQVQCPLDWILYLCNA